MNVGLKQEFVITVGKQVLVLTRPEALHLRDLLEREFAGVTTPVEEAVPPIQPVVYAPVKPLAPALPVNGHSTLAGMKNGDAIEYILKQSGRDMGNREIYAALQEAGHQTTKSGMSATLTMDPRFINIRHGLWGLKNGEAPKPLLTELEETMGSEPWPVASLANLLAVTPERIKETLMFPGTRFEQVEEGVMQLKPQFRV